MQGLNLMPFSRRSPPWPTETRPPALCELSGLTCFFFPGIPPCQSLPQTCTQIRPEPKALKGPVCGCPARALPFQKSPPWLSGPSKPSRLPEAASGDRKPPSAPVFSAAFRPVSENRRFICSLQFPSYVRVEGKSSSC